MYKDNNVLGALVHIKIKTLKKALKLIKHYKIYDLGFELSSQIPVSSADEVPRFLVLPFRTREGTRKEFDGGISFYAEIVQGFIHMSTHIDAFVHAQHNGKIYFYGTPYYDKAKNKLYIKDLDYEVKTKNVLDKLIDSAQLSFALNDLEKKLVYDVDKIKKYQKVFKKQLKSNMELNVNLEKIEIKNIYLDKDYLLLDTMFLGTSLLEK